jgi:hypothetical protein
LPPPRPPPRRYRRLCHLPVPACPAIQPSQPSPLFPRQPSRVPQFDCPAQLALPSPAGALPPAPPTRLFSQPARLFQPRPPASYSPPTSSS